MSMVELAVREAMFEEAQLYSPVTQDEDGKVVVHLGEDHPGFNDPAYRERRNEIATAARLWSPGRARPADRLHRRRGRDLAHRLPRAAHEAREVRVPRVPRGEGRARACPRTACRSSTRSPRGLEPLTGFELPPGRRAGRRCASSTARSPTASSTPPSTSATPPSRSTRPSRTSSTRSSATATCSPRPRFAAAQAPPARRPAASRPTRRCSSSPTSSGSRSSSASCARTASCAPTAPGSSPATARSRSSAHMEIRPLDFAEMGDHRVRHHQVPAGALRGRVDGPPRRRRRRVLRGGRRRDARPVRARARTDAGARAGERVRRTASYAPRTADRGARRFGFPPDRLRISVWFLETRVARLPWPTAR